MARRKTRPEEDPLDSTDLAEMPDDVDDVPTALSPLTVPSTDDAAMDNVMEVINDIRRGDLDAKRGQAVLAGLTLLEKIRKPPAPKNVIVGGAGPIMIASTQQSLAGPPQFDVVLPAESGLPAVTRRRG